MNLPKFLILSLLLRKTLSFSSHQLSTKFHTFLVFINMTAFVEYTNV